MDRLVSERTANNVKIIKPQSPFMATTRPPKPNQGGFDSDNGRVPFES